MDDHTDEEKDREIARLKEELEWKETGGVDRITGKAWLTTRMHLEAEILELRMKLEEKDKEIERLKAKLSDISICLPINLYEYFFQEEIEKRAKEDSDG